jgi:hypothetical protein
MVYLGGAVLAGIMKVSVRVEALIDVGCFPLFHSTSSGIWDPIKLIVGLVLEETS